jgi:uncharacterized protein (TIGR00266 family)
MRKCHEVDYEIVGEGMQMLVVELDGGEAVIAEAGVMNWMDDGIEFETKLGDGSDPDQGFFGKIVSAGVRAVTGESLFMTHFTHRGSGKAKIGFAAPYPGSVVAVDMSTIGGEVVCQKDSFLSAALGTKVTVTFSKKLGAGLFGGEGFILQKLEGDGMAFMHAGGTVMKRELNNETIRVDTGCLVGFTPSVDYSIERAGGLKSMLFGGEGLFLTTLSGTGTVWLQSLPFSRLADRILAFAPSIGGAEKGED